MVGLLPGVDIAKPITVAVKQVFAHLTLIAHISDLHFGAASERAVNALLQSLKESQPDIVVVTGDLTQAGRKHEFEQARAFLGALPAEHFVIPGNHDVPVRNLWARFVKPYGRYAEYVSQDINPVHAQRGLTIVGLNSARRAAADVNWSYGRLSRVQIGSAASQLGAAPAQSIKAVAVHHPFVRGPGRAGARTVGRGDEALAAFVANGLDLALTGHVHHSRAELLAVGERNIVLVQAGTATSVRTRHEAPAYNMISTSQRQIDVTIFSLGAASFEKDRSVRFHFKDDIGWAGEST